MTRSVQAPLGVLASTAKTERAVVSGGASSRQKTVSLQVGDRAGAQEETQRTACNSGSGYSCLPLADTHCVTHSTSSSHHNKAVHASSLPEGHQGWRHHQLAARKALLQVLDACLQVHLACKQNGTGVWTCNTHLKTKLAN